eukprot:1391804-Amorphochlora_amoeboformis.AAC.2
MDMAQKPPKLVSDHHKGRDSGPSTRQWQENTPNFSDQFEIILMISPVMDSMEHRLHMFFEPTG